MKRGSNKKLTKLVISGPDGGSGSLSPLPEEDMTEESGKKKKNGQWWDQGL